MTPFEQLDKRRMTAFEKAEVLHLLKMHPQLYDIFRGHLAWEEAWHDRMTQLISCFKEIVDSHKP